MSVARVDTRGRIQIPRAERQACKIQPGDLVYYKIEKVANAREVASGQDVTKYDD